MESGGQELSAEEANRQAFLEADSQRLLDEAYDTIREQHLRGQKTSVVPALFSEVHAHSAERPIIGGSAKYQELWDNLQAAAAEDEAQRAGSPAQPG